MSQPSRAVYIFLKINKIPFEPKAVALRKGEHYSDEYKKVNPFSLVPVLDDNGFILTERTNLQAQARVDEYMNWQHWNTRLKSAYLFRNLLIEPKALSRPVDWDKVEQFRTEVKKTVKFLENVWLKDQPFLCGQEISVADILGICELIQLYAVNEEYLYEENSVVKAWMDRVKERLQPHFDEAHKLTYRTRDMYPMIKEQLAKL
ncbi:GST [Mytilus edulis]|uniref:GST n=1 Tax=Mytilus edulis TaxID=6550 RepID=A0A8S3RSB2_MYTED|nr:GST [Mytilus edulis]